MKITDPIFAARLRVEEVLVKLNTHGYRTCDDKIGTFAKDSKVFYKEISKDKYVIFNHSSHDGRIEQQTIDCWVAIYLNENDIGRNAPKALESIKLSFEVNRDWGIIDRLFNSELSK